MNIEADAIDSPLPWAAAHIDQYLASDGEDVDYSHADSLILLYTTGRKSGIIRRIPIVALRDDGGWLVMASKGGAPQHPEWYLNLVADPRVWVRDGKDLVEATATTLDLEERAMKLRDFVALIPVFEEYEKKAARVIPMVRLAPKA